MATLFDITAEVRGARATVRTMEKVEYDFKYNFITPEFKAYCLERIKKRMEAGRDNNDEPFAPLQPSTVKKRKATGPILIDTGTLIGAIAEVRSNAKLGVRAYDTFSIGVKNKRHPKGRSTQLYGKFHMEGTAKMVSRQFLGWSENDIRAIRAKIAKMVKKLTPKQRGF